MKKKLLLMLAMVAFVVCLLAISASAVEVDGIYYTLNGSGEDVYAAVNSENRANCKKEDVVIPATITVEGVTYKVTEIYGSAFGGTSGSDSNNQYIKTLTIGANVSKVGAHAFRELANLESVTIANTTATEGITFSNAEFLGCTKLTGVYASTAKVTKFGSYCFRDCSNLATFEYPSTLTSIGYECFKGCSNLESGDLSGTQVVSIEGWAFGNCTSISKFVFPNTLASIGNNCFQNGTFTSIVLPHSFSTIANDAFAFCNNLSLMVLPEFDENDSINAAFLYGTKPKVVIYAGTNYEYLKKAVSNFTSYEVSEFDNYDPNATYTINTIFYGATTCSSCNGLLTGDTLVFTDVLSEMKKQSSCTNCLKTDVKAVYDPIFVTLGYSVDENSCAIVQGFKINEASLSKYNELFAETYGELTTYGVLAVAKANVDETGTAFNSGLEAKAGVVSADFTTEVKTNFAQFDIKVKDIPSAYANMELYMCAYVIVGGKVCYIDHTGVTSVLTNAVSYNTAPKN